LELNAVEANGEDNGGLSIKVAGELFTEDGAVDGGAEGAETCSESCGGATFFGEFVQQ
jgi:hypothetical protein